MNIFLSAHSIRVNKGKAKKDSDKPEYCVLSRLNGNRDFFDVAVAFLKDLIVTGTDDNRKTYMKTVHGIVDGRTVSGKVESGVYGISSKILNVDTDSVAYKKGENDADVLPFYFLIYIPSGAEDKGILILQRTGNYGIQDRFNSYLNDYLDDRFPGLSVEINSLVDLEKIKKDLRRGKIKKVRCVRFNTSSDRFDSLDERSDEKSYTIEISLSSNLIPMKDKVLNFLGTDMDDMDVKSLIELRDFDFEYDTVKLEVDVDSSRRVFDLGNLRCSRNYYNISSKIVKDTDGQPTFESIDKEAKSYLEQILKRTYT